MQFFLDLKNSLIINYILLTQSTAEFYAKDTYIDLLVKFLSAC